MKERMKHIVDLAMDINAIRSEWFVDVEIRGWALPAFIHIFNTMAKTSEDYGAFLFGKEVDSFRAGTMYDKDFKFAEGRLEDILKEIQGR